MATTVPNYRETIFQHPNLTSIRGDPTYSSLAQLERECKANAQSLRSNIGNGNHGYLGLVSSPLAYDRVSPDVPFVRPALPVLPDLENATAAQITEAHRQFSALTATFNTCNLIERTITQQINTALDDDCLADLINSDTGLLQGTIPQIFVELYRTFGAISPQTLAAAKATLEATVYQHARPVANIFTAITKYADMAEAAESAETTTQLINIGLIIITRPTVFANDIRNWHERPQADKTWPNFRTHFRDAQRAIIRSLPATTTDSLGYHEQANAASVASVVDQVIDRLSTQHTPDSAITPDSAAEQLAEQQMQFQLNHMANASQNSQSMQEQMQALQSTLANLQTHVNNTHRNNQGGGGGGGRRSGRGRGQDRGGRGTNRGAGRSTGRGHAPRAPSGPPDYCWTHGNCSHPSRSCENKAEGHIDTATYDSMQGGNEYRCTWL
jgi:hypothetical protein